METLIKNLKNYYQDKEVFFIIEGNQVSVLGLNGKLTYWLNEKGIVDCQWENS